MSRAVREALWLREAQQRARPPKIKPPLKDGQHGRWCVVRVYEREGRSVVVLSGVSADRAEREAGRMRDASTEADIARGWNYLPRPMRR